MNSQMTKAMFQALQSSEKYWEIKNQTETSAELYLYSTISSWGEEWGDTSAKDVINAVKALGNISQALGDLEDDYLEHAEICMRRSDYLALVDTLANGNASLYAAPPEAILGIPAFFCDKAVKPIIGDFSYSHFNYFPDVIYDKDKDVNGALETTAKTMQDNLSGDITSLKSALEGVENTIFSSLEAPFRDAAQNVTKELRDLNAACSEGELADSLKRSAEALSGFISKMAAFAADTAFSTLIKWLEWVANHADAIISAIKGMGAAWAAWKIMQYATHLQELVSAIKLVKSAAAASAVAQNALAVSGASAAASEEALAAAAKTMASAQMLGYAAVIALTVALASFIAKQIDAASANLSQKNQLDETTQAIYDQANAYAKASQAAEENSKKADEGAATAKRYWQQVQNLVDADGRATGSTDALKSAVARLNETAGTNIEVVNGQIQGYKDLAATMDDYIERTRREAKMSYMKDNYGEAVANIEETTAQYEQALDEKWAAYEDYDKKITALREAEAKGYSEDKPYVTLLEEAEAAGDRLSDAEVRLQSLAQLKNNYEKTMEEYEDLLDTPLPSNSKTREDAIREAAEAEAKRIEE